MDQEVVVKTYKYRLNRSLCRKKKRSSCPRVKGCKFTRKRGKTGTFCRKRSNKKVVL